MQENITFSMSFRFSQVPCSREGILFPASLNSSAPAIWLHYLKYTAIFLTAIFSGTYFKIITSLKSMFQPFIARASTLCLKACYQCQFQYIYIVLKSLTNFLCMVLYLIHFKSMTKLGLNSQDGTRLKLQLLETSS